MNYITVNDQSIGLSDEGYLLDQGQWSEEVANALAENDFCSLTEEHWKIIYYVRKFYEEFDHSPAIRILIKSLKSELGEDKANSQYLYELFPYGPAKQATKYAGLPKPKHCI